VTQNLRELKAQVEESSGGKGGKKSRKMPREKDERSNRLQGRKKSAQGKSDEKGRDLTLDAPELSLTRGMKEGR